MFVAVSHPAAGIDLRPRMSRLRSMIAYPPHLILYLPVDLFSRSSGVGVIVDTYRNEEFFSSHRDVAVVINTGNL